MAQTQPPVIPSGPTTPPDRGNKDAFSAAFEAFLTWFLGNFALIITAIGTAYSNAVDAYNSATTALNAANSALATTNATPWVSGTTYAKNVAAISQVNFQTYRRAVAGAGTTDPANDQTNWRVLTGNDSNGAFAPVAMAASDMNLALGNYFTMSTAANTTLTFSNIPTGGYSWMLELITTAAITLALPSSVKPFNNVSLQANKRHLLMFVTSNGGTAVSLITAANGVM